jgi:hypothetical protein
VGRADSPLRDRMVFVVGAPRSGTNWLQRMLAAHRDVVTMPSETHLFTEAIDVLAARVQHGLVTSTSTGSVFMDRDAFLDATREFCDRAFGGVADILHPGAARVVERSPNHVERLDVVAAVFPDAWFVHIVRDGRDVARSLVSQPWGPTSVEEAAEDWARSVRAAQAAAPALARYRQVRYEDLLAEPITEMRGLLEWLGLTVDDDTLAAVDRAGASAYNVDERDPRIAVGKWRREWSRRDLAAFDRVAGEVNRALGYLPAAVDRPRSRRPSLRRTGRGARRQPAPARLPLEARQRVIDRFLAAAAAGDADGAVADIAEGASVRVVTADGDRACTGPSARELVASTIRAEGPWGTQVRGDVHLGGALAVAVVAHRPPGGRVADRVVAMRFDEADRIAELTFYRFSR